MAQVPPPPAGVARRRHPAGVLPVRAAGAGSSLRPLPRRATARLVYAPPQRVRLFHEGRLVGPFIYPFERSIDPLTTQRIYTPNKESIHRIRFFLRGEPYRFWGLFDADLHLFGVDDGAVVVLGADSFGRDLFTRNLYAARVSLSVGLVGVALSFVLGIFLGGVSGYYGGRRPMRRFSASSSS